jgi:hypothetical protein
VDERSEDPPRSIRHVLWVRLLGIVAALVIGGLAIILLWAVGATPWQALWGS